MKFRILSAALIFLISVVLPIRTLIAEDAKPEIIIFGTYSINLGETAYFEAQFRSIGTIPSSDQILYTWTLESIPAGSQVLLESNSSDKQARFQPDIPGTYRVKLVATVGLVESNPAYATVVVTKKQY